MIICFLKKKNECSDEHVMKKAAKLLKEMPQINVATELCWMEGNGAKLEQLSLLLKANLIPLKQFKSSTGL